MADMPITEVGNGFGAAQTLQMVIEHCAEDLTQDSVTLSGRAFLILEVVIGRIPELNDGTRAHSPYIASIIVLSLKYESGCFDFISFMHTYRNACARCGIEHPEWGLTELCAAEVVVFDLVIYHLRCPQIHDVVLEQLWADMPCGMDSPSCASLPKVVIRRVCDMWCVYRFAPFAERLSFEMLCKAAVRLIQMGIADEKLACTPELTSSVLRSLR